MSNGELNLFLLKADGLVCCRWDGKSERIEIRNRALDGETVRELAPDPFQRNRLYVATLTEIHISEDGGESWKWLPSGGLDYRDIWTMPYPQSCLMIKRSYLDANRDKATNFVKGMIEGMFLAQRDKAMDFKISTCGMPPKLKVVVSVSK